jgi:hypothetical protein
MDSSASLIRNCVKRCRRKALVAARGATFADIEHAERPIEIGLGGGIRVTGRIDLIRRRCGSSNKAAESPLTGSLGSSPCRRGNSRSFRSPTKGYEQLAMRLLYLTAGLRSVGSDYFWGRKLFERLRDRCETDPLLAYAVWADAWTESGDIYEDRWANQIVSEQAFRAFAPDVIVIEGGMFEGGSGRWRIPPDLLRQTIARGGVVIAADNSRSIFEDDACWEALHSADGRQLTGVAPRRDRLYEEMTGGRVQYLGDPDNTGRYGALICHPERMILPADWVMPTFDGVERVAVSQAVAIVPHGVWLATGNVETTGALLNDYWVDRSAHLPWATAWQVDAGFMVFISGVVTSARLLGQGDNDVWLTNIATYLLQVVEREAQARAPLRRLNEALRAGQQLTTYLDDAAAGEVYARIADAQADEEIRRAMRADDLPAAEGSLREALDEHLDALAEHSRRSLLTGELARLQLDELARSGADLEYAGPTHLFSRALEIELHQRLFAPFRETGQTRLPDPSAGDQRAAHSIHLLEIVLRKGKPLSLGAMAQILTNLGEKLADSAPNDFAAFLHDRLEGDATKFCASWPREVSSYVDRYRNEAAHTGTLSREDCEAARAYLVGEPRRLLAALIAAAPRVGGDSTTLEGAPAGATPSEERG